MIFLVDIGNTNIVFGISDGEKIFNTLRCKTIKEKDFDYLPVLENLFWEQEKIEGIEACLISSVVPEVTPKICKAISSMYGVKSLVVDDNIHLALDIDMDYPERLGMDLKVDALAALKNYPCPQVIFDLGTATTYSVLDEKGCYVGGAILPGLKISVDALVEKTSQLPVIDCNIPIRSSLGKNTEDCMRLGAICGHAYAIDGFIRSLEEEVSKELHVVLTGGLAPLVRRYMKTEKEIKLAPYLTLEGLLYLHQEIYTGKGGE